MDCKINGVIKYSDMQIQSTHFTLCHTASSSCNRWCRSERYIKHTLGHEGARLSTRKLYRPNGRERNIIKVFSVHLAPSRLATENSWQSGWRMARGDMTAGAMHSRWIHIPIWQALEESVVAWHAHMWLFLRRAVDAAGSKLNLLHHSIIEMRTGCRSQPLLAAEESYKNKQGNKVTDYERINLLLWNWRHMWMCHPESDLKKRIGRRTTWKLVLCSEKHE